MNSTPQLRKILFENLGLTPVKKTKTGPSTDADSLQKMADDHPIVETLLRYREVEKLRGTYADALPPLVQADGRIHATFNQLATTTGPHLVGVAEPAEHSRAHRERARAAQGVHRRRRVRAAHRRLLADRAACARAPRRRSRVSSKRSSAAPTSTPPPRPRVFDVAEDKVDDFQRRFAKVVNYGLAYGMEAYGLAQRLDIPTDQAREILDAYFEAFPNVAGYMQ